MIKTYTAATKNRRALNSLISLQLQSLHVLRSWIWFCSYKLNTRERLFAWG